MTNEQNNTKFTELELVGSRSDFNLEAFETKLAQHGLNLSLEEAMRCPCSVEANGNPLVNCVNCYGTGWIFGTARKKRGIISSLNFNQKLLNFSDITSGTASLTVEYDNRLSWMDRIKLLDGEDIFFEVLYFVNRTLQTENGGKIFVALLNYEVEEVVKVLYFQGAKLPLVELNETQYEITGRVFKLLDSALFPTRNGEKKSVSIRYKFLPAYHVLEVPHNIRNTRKFEASEGSLYENLKKFPINCMIKKAHYILGSKKFLNIPDGDKIIKDSVNFGAVPSLDYQSSDNSQNIK